MEGSAGGGRTAIEGEHIPDAALDGRQAAFHRLVDEELDRSYAIARLIMRDPHDAEDATHDAMVTAWQKWPSLRELDRFVAWFGRILVNACRDRLRRRHVRQSVALDERARDAHDAYRPIDDRDALDRAFTALNADQRAAIVLRFYADLTIEQIAQRTRARPGTVKSRLHHALRQLRTALEAVSEVDS